MKKFALIFLMTSQMVFGMVGLKVGDNAPNLTINDIEGKEFNFSKQADKTVVVFYRGAWCPYCVNQLKEIQSDLLQKIDGKAKVVAVSVDKPSVAKKMHKKFKLSFNVLSDSKAKSLKAFGIVNQLSDDLVKKYKSAYKIDVEGDSGETHHMIAHPAVFIIDQGKVTFADIHTDYKQRTKHSAILKAL